MSRCPAGPVDYLLHLIRLSLVLAYDIALFLAATAFAAGTTPSVSFLAITLRWLGPMLFLSGLALTVSLRCGNLPGTVVPLMAWAGYVFLSIPSAPWHLSLLLASRAAGLLLTISGLGLIVYAARCAARWGLVVRWD